MLISRGKGLSLMQKKITKSTVEQLNEPGYCRDPELKGFYVRVSRGKRNGFLSKTYLVHGKPKGWSTNITVTIGRHGLVSSDWARTEAKRLLGLMANGINPNTEKRAQIKVAAQIAQDSSEKEKLTLAMLLAEYLENRNLREKTVTDYGRFLNRCLSDWMQLPVTAITRDMVQKRYLQLGREHRAQANYTMRVLRALFKYAIAVYEDSDGRPVISSNPVDRLKHARLWTKPVRRQSLIQPQQLRTWYEAVCGLQSLEARDVLLLELFTGLRHCEAINLEWRNVDFHREMLLIEDTKNHSDFMLPMTSWLLSLMKRRFEISGSSRFVFPSPVKDSALSSIRPSILEVVKSTGIRFAEHDLRRTFETTAESLDVSYYTLKRLLNHRTGSDPTAGYIVTSAERMRTAAQKVADHLAHTMGISSPDRFRIGAESSSIR